MLFKKSLIASTVFSLLVLPYSAIVWAWSDDDLAAQINAQQSTMLKMQNTFDEMQAQIDAQNGRIDELKYEISKLRNELNTLKQNTVQNSDATNANSDQANADAKQANTDGSKAQNTSDQSKAQNTASVTDAKGNSLKKADDSAKKKYNEAYQMVVANRLSESIPAFKSYLEKYPDNELTPNAWYWQGQVQFKLKKYDDARLCFLNAASFKNSPKRPDSLYKLGLISKQAGDMDKAKRFFSVVVKNYPDDASATLAKKQLSSM